MFCLCIFIYLTVFLILMTLEWKLIKLNFLTKHDYSEVYFSHLHNLKINSNVEKRFQDVSESQTF